MVTRLSWERGVSADALPAACGDAGMASMVGGSGWGKDGFIVHRGRSFRAHFMQSIKD